MAKVITDKNLIDEALGRSVEQIYPSKENLRELLLSGKRIKIYLGVDPTGPHMHLGHLTNLLVLKRLQELGHEIILLIGDFTARIGDPTDKAAVRKVLSPADVKQNMRTFKQQASRIIVLRGSNAAKIKLNSKWLGKMKLSDWLEISMKITVQQMLGRDMFERRLEEGRPVGFHEFAYPLMQGYDSVALDVDMEIGGTDQTFNMLMGRQLVKVYKNKEKFVLTTKLLEHPKTGKKLMNKSEGGLINLDDPPEEIFGKVMALDDASMFPVAEFCTEMEMSRIKELEKEVNSKKLNPRDAKFEVAEEVVGVIYGAEDARKAREKFEKLFSKKEMPDDLPELKVPFPASVSGIVLSSGIEKSKSAALRLIEQGGVSINDETHKDPREMVRLKDGDVLRIGKKRFFKAKI